MNILDSPQNVFYNEIPWLKIMNYQETITIHGLGHLFSRRT